MSTPIVVISTERNAGDIVHRGIQSVTIQRDPNFRHIFIDAKSDDGTLEKVRHIERIAGRAFELRVTEYGPAENLCRAVHELPPETIVVCLDGDDWFPHERVLARVRAAYEGPRAAGEVEPWLTYGSFRCEPSPGPFGDFNATAHPPEVIAANAYRRDKWRATHLKTFRAGLYQRIDWLDLHTDTGEWGICTDQLIMLPMLEMAGERHKFIREPLYVYNWNQPDNSVTNPAKEKLSYDDCLRIRAMPPYARLAERPW